MKVNEKMSFGTVLKRRRQSRGLTQRDLAKMIGMDQSYYSRIEHNAHAHLPSAETILKFCAALCLKEWERAWLFASANKIDPEIERIVVQSQELPGFKKELLKMIDRIKKKAKPIMEEVVKEIA